MSVYLCLYSVYYYPGVFLIGNTDRFSPGKASGDRVELRCLVVPKRRNGKGSGLLRLKKKILLAWHLPGVHFHRDDRTLARFLRLSRVVMSGVKTQRAPVHIGQPGVTIGWEGCRRDTDVRGQCEKAEAAVYPYSLRDR